MKKLSLIVAMAVVLTIGGVFATWSYAENGAVDSINNHVASSITVAGTDTVSKGTLSADGKIMLTFDNAGANKVGMSKNGEITIKFTPAADSYLNAPESINVKITAKLINAGTYGGSTIIKFADGGEEKVVEASTSVNAAGIVLDQDDFDFIVLTKTDVVLASSTEYTNFKDAVNHVEVQLTIEEV